MRLEGIYKSFGEEEVLHDINISINDKEITCILGPSGCGKSTLLNIIAGIIKPDKGTIKESKKKKSGMFFRKTGCYRGKLYLKTLSW